MAYTPWPEKKGYHLTEWAENAFLDFCRDYDGNCSCHISPPCGSCTHEGNPFNLEETDVGPEYGVWEPDVAPTVAFDILNEMLG